MGGVCLLSHMCPLSLVLLAVFFASVNNDILFSIYLLFNTFIIINILHFIWKIYLFVSHFLIQVSLIFFFERRSR
jgi:hypothetical protein